ncbi:MAG: 30S ribosomal protein S6 [Bacilli bacterium]|nr:30S ribosomal protein S6 [Bacilli bacterium]
MNKYEVIFIVKPDLEEAAITKEADAMKKVLTGKKAKVVEEKAWGQKELAYEIRKYKTGYYFYYLIEADSKAIDEFDRIAKINENLLRSLIIRVEE